jgi:hypothetical protein
MFNVGTTSATRGIGDGVLLVDPTGVGGTVRAVFGLLGVGYTADGVFAETVGVSDDGDFAAVPVASGTGGVSTPGMDRVGAAEGGSEILDAGLGFVGCGILGAVSGFVFSKEGVGSFAGAGTVLVGSGILGAVSGFAGCETLGTISGIVFRKGGVGCFAGTLDVSTGIGSTLSGSATRGTGCTDAGIALFEEGSPLDVLVDGLFGDACLRGASEMAGGV